MPYFNITAFVLANALGVPIEKMYRILQLPEFRNLLPRVTGKHRLRLSANQAFIVLITGDCIRFGMKAPLAASIALRIAEVMLFSPDADTVTIEFRRNGASFAFVGDEATDAANAAGPARWRLSFSAATYRSAVEEMMSDCDAAHDGDDDVE